MVVAAYPEVFEMRMEKYASNDYKNLVQNESKQIWSFRAFPILILLLLLCCKKKYT